jgi:thioesterase domain-containing protein/acyl carrier protein
LLAELPQVRALDTRTAGVAQSGLPGADTGRTVAELTGPQRDAALNDLIRRTVAGALGRPDLAGVPDDQPFVELGLDSLSAVEIRNRLGVATGLELPAMLVFDHPSVAALAVFLAGALDDSAFARRTGPAGDTGDDAESFAGIYRTEVEALLTGASGARTRFGDPAAARTGLVRLATGADAPMVICFPPFAPVEQSLQFARMAMFFRERRDLTMVEVPGFQPGSDLADSLGTLIEVLAGQAAAAAEGRPFVLMGYSSSGWMAHAVATALEERGLVASGVVLLDTYLPDSMSLPLRQAMNYEVNERRARFTTMNLTTLTALGTYRAMFRPWQPAPISAPTLFLAPQDCIPGDPAAGPVPGDWQARWPLPHTRVTVPGDHCTIVAEHAAEAAAAIHTWLSEGQS